MTSDWTMSCRDDALFRRQEIGGRVYGPGHNPDTDTRDMVAKVRDKLADAWNAVDFWDAIMRAQYELDGELLSELGGLSTEAKMIITRAYEVCRRLALFREIHHGKKKTLRKHR